MITKGQEIFLNNILEKIKTKFVSNVHLHDSASHNSPSHNSPLHNATTDNLPEINSIGPIADSYSITKSNTSPVTKTDNDHQNKLYSQALADKNCLIVHLLPPEKNKSNSPIKSNVKKAETLQTKIFHAPFKKSVP